MRIFTIGGCVLLAGMLPAIVACNKLDTHDVDLKTHPVKITNCEPDKDPVRVKNADQVEWLGADDSYQVTFDTKAFPNVTDEPILHNKADVPKGSSVKVPVNGHTKCSTQGCYYKYNIARLKNGVPESTFCNDPGVRIVP
jgi:hypothetical protein